MELGMELEMELALELEPGMHRTCSRVVDAGSWISSWPPEHVNPTESPRKARNCFRCLAVTNT